MSAENLKRVPELIREQKSLSGAGFNQLMSVCKRNQEILNVVERDNRDLRMTKDMLTVRLSKWIPFDSITGMEKFFLVRTLITNFKDI